MSAPYYYSGPAKVVSTNNNKNSAVIFNLQAEGENGQVKITLDEKTTQRGSAMYGRTVETLDDQIAKVSITPFDSWALLPYLFPAYLGVATGQGFTAGAYPTLSSGGVAIGTRPHDYTYDNNASPQQAATGSAPAKVWTPDGRLFTLPRHAITKHPNLKLGVGQPFYSDVELTGLVALAQTIGSSSALTSVTGDTGAPQSDPNAGFTPDFINGHWTATWGSQTDFVAFDSEDGFELVPEVKYSPLTVQKLTRHMKLDSVNFMLKCRPTGPAHSDILSHIVSSTRLLGGPMVEGGYSAYIGSPSPTTLVLSGPASKCIGMQNATVKGAGFEFGGTKLNNGEIGFVCATYFTGIPGVPVPTLAFSL